MMMMMIIIIIIIIIIHCYNNKQTTGFSKSYEAEVFKSFRTLVYDISFFKGT